MRTLHANTMTFYIWYLSIHRFWCQRGLVPGTSSMWIPKVDCIKLCHLNTVKVLLFPFLTCKLFILFSHLIAKSSNIINMLYKSGKSGYLCLVPDLIRKILIFLKIECAISYGIFICSIYYVEVFPLSRKWRRTKEPLDESERGEWKSWLKTQHSEK